ncbi:cytochrome p450 [Diplodia corticola]|uniref:Cytochrome p450 n=1 Tax=Diplodia corticola TaxID=236234 RepID=A0A1J9QWF1_9PEZI|nr:cytochrome p450 [Diplodia corticola]OJD32330.1 cytochrome p450 [Diplodia corticola]
MALNAFSPASFSSSYLWPSFFFLILLPLVLTVLHDIALWRRMPPGPPPLPFIGNKHQLPKSQPWLQFTEWAKVYGPIFTLWIGRRPTVVISDPRLAAELLEKRSNKYSSRPRMVAMGELLWDNASILVQPYGKAWSARRKLLHQALTPKALQLYKPVQEAEAARLCAQLLTAPADFEKLIERFTASVVFCVAYGHRIDSLHADVIRQRFEFMQYSASLNVPGRYLVETFPALKYVPDWLAPWKADIKAHGAREAAANMALVDVVRQDMRRASPAHPVPNSLCKMLLELRAKDPDASSSSSSSLLSDRDFSFLPASLFGAGSDTTASTLCTALLALVTHPHVLAAAHAELDAVVGPDRLPTFADEPGLPYMRALVKEVLRWRPVAVLGGTPHATTAADDVVVDHDIYPPYPSSSSSSSSDGDGDSDGDKPSGRRTTQTYHIPAHTTVLANSWAINLHPDYYPHPHLFEPLRFHPDPARRPASLTPLLPHPSNSSPTSPGHSSFGWGRRICPGAGLAANGVFVALARLLWAFDVAGVEGAVYDPMAYTDGFNIRPRRFACVLRPRSGGRAEVVTREAEGGAMAVLGGFGAFGEGGGMGTGMGGAEGEKGEGGKA